MRARSRLVALFRCERLSCVLSEHACVARQLVSLGRAGDGADLRKRGRVAFFPYCHPDLCEQGRRILARGARAGEFPRLRHVWGWRWKRPAPQIEPAAKRRARSAR